MTAASQTPRVTYLSNGTVEVQFPFDRWVVEALKQRIPSTCRSYDPARKIWLVGVELADVAIEILDAAFDCVDVAQGSARGSEPTPIRKHDSEYSEMHLLPTAPGFVIEAVYRALAKASHPDLGGSTVDMQRLNAAYEALQRKAGAA